MTPLVSDALLRRVTGAAALALFLIFAANILLVKIAMTAGFQFPRLSTRAEFLILLATALLGVVFLTIEEKLKKRTLPDPASGSGFQTEEESHD